MNLHRASRSDRLSREGGRPCRSRIYDQEIKSLLLYQLRTSPECSTPVHDLPLRRRSVFRYPSSRGRIERFPRLGVEPTTNGLTVRRSTAEAERTGLEPATPGVTGRYSIRSAAVRGVRISPSSPNQTRICDKCRHRRGGHDGWLHDLAELRRFEVRDDREGLEPSLVAGVPGIGSRPW
jgi:hypothetical protein